MADVVEDPESHVDDSEPLDVQEMVSWDEHNVGVWLRSLHLGEYVGAFQSAGVDGQTLLALSEKDLQNDLLVTNAIHRKKIFAHLVTARPAPADDESFEIGTGPDLVPENANPAVNSVVKQAPARLTAAERRKEQQARERELKKQQQHQKALPAQRGATSQHHAPTMSASHAGNRLHIQEGGSAPSAGSRRPGAGVVAPKASPASVKDTLAKMDKMVKNRSASPMPKSGHGTPSAKAQHSRNQSPPPKATSNGKGKGDGKGSAPKAKSKGQSKGSASHSKSPQPQAGKHGGKPNGQRGGKGVQHADGQRHGQHGKGGKGGKGWGGGESWGGGKINQVVGQVVAPPADKKNPYANYGGYSPY
eukprot:gnl/MRDRNA2_/MRDRNA2_116719_c0_seq1.p1 gnl/MRDRNA2_/MRDRNA2_116719_c0~~gnl/MRDRNA2_/MRDRNA2_116719_c0_seq1.p1  ORF type:complete len:416 (+),score=93.06 gnl/MRDRNA2_/MRDRNA2_116719_c0_seq1:168-1250(+)